MDKKTGIQQIISQAGAELSDAGHRRWSADTLVAYVNEGLLRLAEEGVFRRVDLAAGRAGVGFYPTLAEPVRILGCRWEGRALHAVTEAELERRGGAAWRSRRGRPACFLALADGVRVYPAPEEDAAALALPAAPLLSSADGAKIDGDGWAAAFDGANAVHFRDGDPGAPDFAGPGTLRIDYAYHPRPSESSDAVPTRLAEALRLYLLARCLATAEAPEEARRAEEARALWAEAHLRAVTHSAQEARAAALWFAPLEAR